MKKLILALILVALSVIPAMAKGKTYGTYTVSRINSVYDGDTFRCDIEGVPAIIGNNIAVRVFGVDTPEMKDKRPHIKQLAVKARNAVRRFLSAASVVELRSVRRGKYFRIVADVYADGKSLRAFLLKSRLAHEYYGGKKRKWK